MKIGVLSDTHGVIAPQVYSFFEACDELWHAGDIGGDVYERLSGFKPLVAVYGNCDEWALRMRLQQTRILMREGKKVIMTHIGGRPGRYERRLLPLFDSERADIFVCGHSHICCVRYDEVHNHLYINPGAAGRQGIHTVCTLVRFELDETIHDMKIMEFPRP